MLFQHTIESSSLILVSIERVLKLFWCIAVEMICLACKFQSAAHSTKSDFVGGDLLHGAETGILKEEPLNQLTLFVWILEAEIMVAVVMGTEIEEDCTCLKHGKITSIPIDNHWNATIRLTKVSLPNQLK